MYKKIKKVDGIQISYYYCLQCAEKLKLYSYGAPT